jgi:hypothetical protein
VKSGGKTPPLGGWISIWNGVMVDVTEAARIEVIYGEYVRKISLWQPVAVARFSRSR